MRDVTERGNGCKCGGNGVWLGGSIYMIDDDTNEGLTPIRIST